MANAPGCKPDAVKSFAGSSPASPNRLLQDRLAVMSVQNGEFQLSGGGISAIYFDCRPALLDGSVARLAGDAILREIESWSPAANAFFVGGIGFGGALLVSATIAAAERDGFPMTKGILARTVPKTHGTMKFVEGFAPEGGRVLVVDDVVTTGSSASMAIRTFEASGMKVVGFVGLIEREGRGLDYLRKEHGIHATCLFRGSDLLKLF